MKLIKNRIFAIIIFILGIAPILIDRDGTFFIFSAILAGSLWFSKEDVIR